MLARRGRMLGELGARHVRCSQERVQAVSAAGILHLVQIYLQCFSPSRVRTIFTAHESVFLHRSLYSLSRHASNFVAIVNAGLSDAPLHASGPAGERTREDSLGMNWQRRENQSRHKQTYGKTHECFHWG